MCFAQTAALLGVQKSQVRTKRHLQKFKRTSAETSELADPKYGMNAPKTWSVAGSEAPGGPSGQPGQRPDRPGTILEASRGVPDTRETVLGRFHEARGRPRDAPGTVRVRFRTLLGPSGAVFWAPEGAPG